MSDHKGARLILDALPPPKRFLPIAAMTAIGSEPLWASEAASLAYLPPKAGKSRCLMTRRSTSSVTGSRTCSPSSRTGGVSLPAMIDALTPTSRPSASQRQSHSISINEFLSLVLTGSPQISAAILTTLWRANSGASFSCRNLQKYVGKLDALDRYLALGDGT